MRFQGLSFLVLVVHAHCFTGPALNPSLQKSFSGSGAMSASARHLHMRAALRISPSRSYAASHAPLSMGLFTSLPAVFKGIASLAPGMATGPFVAAAAFPTLLGFWKSEYGVSYAYGLAMFSSGLLALPHCVSPLAQLHACAYILYGLRLNLFLLYREINIPTFREFKERIEERAKAKGSRLTRTPFIVMCSLLYLGMAAPLQITAKAALPTDVATVLLSLMFFGGGIAALGDAQKTLKKVGQPNKLVTGGLFSLLRHPNFTGEVILWTSSFALAVTTAVSGASLTANAAWLAFSFVGMIGINFVLVQAATGLEKKQKEKYGELQEYKDWVTTTWSGPTFPQNKA